MVNLDYTLRDFFRIDSDAIETATRDELNKEDWLANIRKATKAGPHGVVLHTVLDKVSDVLDIQLSTILVGGWVQWHRIRDQLREAITKREESFLIPLLEHKLKSTHKPHIDIYVNDKPAGRIDIQVTLTVDVKSALLRVEQGLITEIQLGSCTASGKVTLEGVQIAEKKSQPLPLTGAHRLEEPFDLARVMQEPSDTATETQAQIGSHA